MSAVTAAPAPAAGAGWTEAGVLLRAHGLRGEVRARLACDPAAVPWAGLSIRLTPRGDESMAQEVRVVRARGFLAAEVILALDGCCDRDAAEGLRGARLALPVGALAAPAADESYVYELAGAAVVDRADVRLGEVTAVYDNAGQDLLAIATPAGERLLPMVPPLVLGFDRVRRQLRVDVPPGLWDDRPG